MTPTGRFHELLDKAADASFHDAFAQGSADALAMLVLVFPPVYWNRAHSSISRAVASMMVRDATAALPAGSGLVPPLPPVRLHALQHCGIATAHSSWTVDLSTPQHLVYAAGNDALAPFLHAAPPPPLDVLIAALDMAAASAHASPDEALDLVGVHGQIGDALDALLAMLDARATAMFDTAGKCVGARRAAMLCVHRFQQRTGHEVRDRLGAGAFGTVFSVADAGLAVKITCVDDTLDAEVRVSQAVATVAHTGKRCVMRYLDWGSFTFDPQTDLWHTAAADMGGNADVTTAYMLMPRATGDLWDFAGRLTARSAGADCDRLLRFVACVLVGFEAAHLAGYVLCDLKPENVVVFDAPPFAVPPRLAADATKGWAVLSDLANCVPTGAPSCRGTRSFVAPPGSAWGFAPFSTTDEWGRASTPAMDYAQLGKTIVALFADLPSRRLHASLLDLPPESAMLAALDGGRELLGTRMRCPAGELVELVKWAVGAIRGCFAPASSAECFPPLPAAVRAEMGVVRALCDEAGDPFFAQSDDEADQNSGTESARGQRMSVSPTAPPWKRPRHGPVDSPSL